MRKLIIFILSAFILTGCAQKIDYNRQSLNLSLGMDKQQVSSIMGEPRRTDVNQDRERWIYWNPSVIGFTPIDNEQLAQDRLVVTFVNGKVARWGRQTIADDITENTQKIYQQTRETPTTVIIKNQ